MGRVDAGHCRTRNSHTEEVITGDSRAEAGVAGGSNAGGSITGGDDATMAGRGAVTQWTLRRVMQRDDDRCHDIVTRACTTSAVVVAPLVAPLVAPVAVGARHSLATMPS